jgi:tRNA-2-methylthio-N6-dimethylallyladenosine synthase
VGKLRTYYLETYGCQMNFSDAELIETLLAEEGMTPAGTEAGADVILVNTCGVREHAEQRVLSRLGTLKKCKEDAPGCLIVVCGCMAQRMGEELLRLAPWVDLVVGPDSYRRLPGMLKEISGGRFSRAAALEFDISETYDSLTPLRRDSTSAWVPITRGCDNFCSYCIVPYVRGRERSVDPALVEHQVRECVARGIPEVVLLGQNVNSYRFGDTGFDTLLRRLDRVEGLSWIRFLTSHPRDLSDRIIGALAECPKVVEHLHLPVQSGSNSVLGAMNRGYAREYYIDRVASLRAKLPNLALTTDILVGFPSESERDFLDTVSLMEAVRFDYAFTFRYSVRPGTAAAGLIDSVTDGEKGRRLEEVIRVQRVHTRAALERLQGRELEVLVSAPAKSGNGMFLGRTRTHFSAFLPAEESLVGKIVRARVTGSTGMGLLAEMTERR